MVARRGAPRRFRVVIWQLTPQRCHVCSCLNLLSIFLVLSPPPGSDLVRCSLLIVLGAWIAFGFGLEVKYSLFVIDLETAHQLGSNGRLRFLICQRRDGLDVWNSKVMWVIF